MRIVGTYTNHCWFCKAVKDYWFLGLKCHECQYEDGGMDRSEEA